ncbi:MAG: M20/M25/M40 family metallo-hydrolase [Bacteroidales bacterium]|nr:M20/M25/M40 family metallo-hydrolase [Bacteroidales bacterium]
MRLRLLLLIFAAMQTACIFGQNPLKTTSNQTTPDLDSIITALTADVDSLEIKSTMQELENYGSRYMLHENRHDVALWIKNRFSDMGYEHTNIDEFVTSGLYQHDTTVTQYNVSATLQGVTDTVVIVGAHYDSYNYDSMPLDSAPGADDNASGTAGVLEMARIFKQHQVQPYYTMKFVAFGAEETKGSFSQNGAQAFADKMVDEGKHVQFMLNYDMIANDDTGERKVIAHRAFDDKDYNNWCIDLVASLAEKYTDLQVTYEEVFNKRGRTDDLPFAEYGYKTLYYEEYDFSPNYHSDEDLVVNCETDYAAEVVKLGIASFIHAAYLPDPVNELHVLNNGDGKSVMVIWSESNSKVNSYTVRYGLEPGEWIEEIIVFDTFLTVDDLMTDSLYHFKVTANQANGNESLPRERMETPIESNPENGVLIINSTTENLTGVSRDSLDRYYGFLTTPFVVTTMNVDSASQIDAEVLADYSTVIWHDENKESDFRFSKELMDDLMSYKRWGGHLFFTLYQPTTFFREESQVKAFKFPSGHFARTALHIDSTSNELGKFFHYMMPVSEEFPGMSVDTAKRPSNLLFRVAALHFTAEAEPLYLYGSEYDSISPQGNYHGKPVAITNKGENKNVVITSVPLFYMETDSAKSFVHDILRNKFSEYYVGLPDDSPYQKEKLQAYPNPTSGRLLIKGQNRFNGKVVLKIYSIKGRNVASYEKSAKNTNRIGVGVSHLKNGVYIYFLETENNRYRGKFEVLK